MTMPQLPVQGNTNWRGWASAIHDAATEVTEGRLTEEALGAAYVAKAGAGKTTLNWIVATDPAYGVDATGVTDTTVALQAVLDAAKASSVGSVVSSVNGTTPYPLYPTVFIPDGVYKIAAPLVLPVGVNLTLGKSAVIRAGTTLAGPMLTMNNATGVIAQHFRIEGGIWDANLNAQDGISLPYFANVRIADVQIHNPTRHFLVLGDPGATSNSYEAVITNLDTRRNRGATIPTGSYGIWFRNASDCEVWQAVLNGVDTGVRSDLGNHNLYGVHVWNFGGSAAPTCGFDDNTTTDSIYSGCYVDTVSGQGWRLRKGYGVIADSRMFNNGTVDNVSTAVQNDAAVGAFTVSNLRVWAASRTVGDGNLTSGSAVVTSVTANFAAGDTGRQITGTGVPAGTTIVTVDSPTQVTMSANALTTTSTGSLTVANRIANDITGDISQAEIVELYSRNVTTQLIGNRSRLRALEVRNTIGSSTPFRVQRTAAAASAAADLTQWSDEGGTAIARITNNGEMRANGYSENVITKTSGAYTMGATDSIVISNGMAGITLPSATTSAVANVGTGNFQSRRYRVRNIHATTSCPVGAAAGNVNGAATYNVVAGASATFISDGANWWTI